MDTDEEDGRAGDDGWEELFQDLRRSEGKKDFQQSTETGRANDCAVSVGARQFVSVGVSGAVTVRVHLCKGTGSSGDGSE